MADLGSAMAADRIPDQGKTITVCRNGDFKCTGRKFVLNRRVRNMDSFLTDVSDGLRAQFGAVRQLYTPATGTRIQSLAQLQPNGVYVAGGSERFKQPAKTSYNSTSLPPVSRSTGVRTLPPLTRSQRSVEPRLRMITGPKIIHVYRNGDPFNPGVRLLLDRHTLGNFEQVLARITERVELRNGAVRRLCNMEGSDVYGLKELENGGKYVAVGSSEPFKSLPYGNVEALISPRRAAGRPSLKRPPFRLKPLQKKLAETTPSKPGAVRVVGASQGTTVTKMRRFQGKPRPPAAHGKRSVGVQPPEILLLEAPSDRLSKQRKTSPRATPAATSRASTTLKQQPDRATPVNPIEHPRKKVSATTTSTSNLKASSPALKTSTSSLKAKTPTLKTSSSSLKTSSSSLKTSSSSLKTSSSNLKKSPQRTTVEGSPSVAEHSPRGDSQLATQRSVFRVQTPQDNTEDLAATAAYYSEGHNIFRKGTASNKSPAPDVIAEAQDLVEERPVELMEAAEVSDVEAEEEEDDTLVATQSAPGQLDNIEELLSRVPQANAAPTQPQQSKPSLQPNTGKPKGKPAIVRKVNEGEEEDLGEEREGEEADLRLDDSLEEGDLEIETSPAKERNESDLKIETSPAKERNEGDLEIETSPAKERNEGDLEIETTPSKERDDLAKDTREDREIQEAEEPRNEARREEEAAILQEDEDRSKTRSLSRASSSPQAPMNFLPEIPPLTFEEEEDSREGKKTPANVEKQEQRNLDTSEKDGDETALAGDVAASEEISPSGDLRPTSSAANEPATAAEVND